MGQLKSSSISNNFTYCCVDDKRLKIPPFIKAVPTLYIANQQRVLTDQALLMWLDIELKGQQQQSPAQQQQQQSPAQQQPGNPGNGNGTDDPISAYHFNEIGSGFSDGYSFLEQPDKSLEHSFTFLDEGKTAQRPQDASGQRPGFGEPDTSATTQKGDIMDKAYAQLLEQRKLDSVMPPPPR